MTYDGRVLAALTCLLISGAPPNAAKAESLAKARQWEELYLAFAAADVKTYSDDDKKTIGALLAKGCFALEKNDAVMAYSLGDKAAQFDGSADALLCVGRSGSRADQKTAAEQALKKGDAAYPADTRFPLELGKLALSEKDGPAAISALERVPKKTKDFKEAEALLKQARALKADHDSARTEAEQQQRDLLRKQDAAASGGRPPPQNPLAMAEPNNPGKHRVEAGDSLAYETSTDSEGRRVRQNSHFRFRYFNGQKDFGQRADYEGSVAAALEEAKSGSAKVLGVTREAPTNVILYSREEFAMHHGRGFAASIAGFYSDNAIRMNDSAEMNAQNQAVLVHEYTHAVIDELASNHDERVPVWVNEGLAEYTEWQYQGNEKGPPSTRAALQKYAKSKALPSLQEMTHGMLASGSNPALRYAVSASAVGVLVGRGGMRNVIDFIREVGTGADVDETLKSKFGKNLADLNEEVDAELASSR